MNKDTWHCILVVLGILIVGTCGIRTGINIQKMIEQEGKNK